MQSLVVGIAMKCLQPGHCCRVTMANTPPSFGDLGKSAKDIFEKAFGKILNRAHLVEPSCVRNFRHSVLCEQYPHYLWRPFLCGNDFTMVQLSLWNKVSYSNTLWSVECTL